MIGIKTKSLDIWLNTCFAQIRYKAMTPFHNLRR